MSSSESVDCIFQFLCEGPQFAVVEENTCNICIESSDFDRVADFSAVKNYIFSLPFFIIFCLRIVDDQIARVNGVVSLICYPLFGCGCPTYMICIFRINF